jgi:hypothetical protein
VNERSFRRRVGPPIPILPHCDRCGKACRFSIEVGLGERCIDCFLWPFRMINAAERLYGLDVRKRRWRRQVAGVACIGDDGANT